MPSAMISYGIQTALGLSPSSGHSATLFDLDKGALDSNSCSVRQFRAERKKLASPVDCRGRGLDRHVICWLSHSDWRMRVKVMTDREVAYPPRYAMKRHASVELGRTYFVYEFESKLLVRHARRRRPHETLERCYDIQVVRALARYYSGRTVTVEEALRDIRMGTVQIPIIAYRAHARSDIRDMLIGLCAMDLAKVCTVNGDCAFAVS